MALLIGMNDGAEAKIGSASTADGTVTAVAESGPVVGVAVGTSGPRCVWEPLFLSRNPANDPLTEGDVTFGFDTAQPPATRNLAGVESRLYQVTCPDRGGVQQRWVRLGVNARDLIPGVVDVVEGRVELPVPDINPTPTDGGFVNLGMWLAVQQQAVEPISAEAGTAWITVSPRMVSSEFDLGNGDTIVCEGTGIPIAEAYPDLDVIEQSPTCGYTYRRSSPDDDPYQVTVTTVWELPYTSSDGAGTIPSLRRAITLDYDVDEIQTVGVSN